MMAFLYAWGLSPVAFFLLAFVLLLCTVRTWTMRGRSRSAIILAALTLMAAVPAQQGIPIALTNAGLKNLPVGFGVVPVLRFGVNNPGDAPIEWFNPSSGTCSQHSGAGDVGSCNPSADSKSWVGIFPLDRVDIREFGAVGNGATDYSTQIQDAINLCPGYTIVFPGTSSNAVFRATSGLTVSSYCTLEGSGSIWSTISAAGGTATPVTLTGSHPMLKNISVAGMGSGFTGYTFGANAGTSTILINTGAVNAILEDVVAQGSSAGIIDDGTDTNLLRVFVGGTYDYAFYKNAGNVWSADHLELDSHSWLAQPTYGTTISAYSLNHTYSANATVSLAYGGRTYWMQTPNGGTTNNVANPTPTFFNELFSDNNNGGTSTVTWETITTSTEVSYMSDTGSGETHVSNIDMSDAGKGSLLINSTVGGYVAFFKDIITGGPSQVFGVNFQEGGDTHVSDSEIFGPFGSGNSAVIIGGNYGAVADVHHNLISGGAFGIQETSAAAGGSDMFSYNYIIGSQSDGIVLNANDANVTNNRVQTSGGSDIVTGAGLTRCIIIGNNGFGSAATASYGDSCTSANKTPNQSW